MHMMPRHSTLGVQVYTLTYKYEPISNTKRWGPPAHARYGCEAGQPQISEVHFDQIHFKSGTPVRARLVGGI